MDDSLHGGKIEIYIEGEKPPIMEIDEEEVQEKPRYPRSASQEEASKPAIKELSGEDEET